VSEFYAEALQATASVGLARGPCVPARAGFEPATFYQWATTPHNYHYYLS